MGLFDFIKRNAKKSIDTSEQKQIPTLRNGMPKEYDYFSFKVHGTASIEGSQELLQEIGCDLYEQPDFASVRLEGDSLNVYLKGHRIGSGDTKAKNKFINNCSKKWHVHSCSIYGGKDEKYYGCKIRIKFFY